jgi:RND superfamily putative drug exporter
MLRHRLAVLVSWAVMLITGGILSFRLSPLLSNEFAVPGTDSARVASILARRFGDSGDGDYLVVFTTNRPPAPTLRGRLQAVVEHATQRVPTAHAGPVIAAGGRVFYVAIASRLDLRRAKADTSVFRSALRPPPGVRAYVSGQAAIQHDLDPIFTGDLHRGEFAIALPIAALVLLLILGLSAIVTLPLLFAGATIATTLGLVFGIAHAMTTATYVTNLVELIGLALAVDYSLLVASRFRDELARVDAIEDAIIRTMTTAGRSVVYSGATVALGLALLLFIPVPFVRSLGIGGLLIPLVSVAAATTLLPALLSVYGRRGSIPIRVARRPARRERFWPRLARTVMRRPVLYLAFGSVFLLLAAAPALALSLTPGSVDGVPKTLPAVRGFDLLRVAVGPGLSRPRRSSSTRAASEGRQRRQSAPRLPG